MVHYPYRYFFILGILCAILGVGLWPLSFFGWNLVNDTLLFHKIIMIFGFLLSFACGFLITAYPSFTAGLKINRVEWWMMFIGQILIPIGALLDCYPLSLFGVLLNSVTMLYFMFNRSITGKNKLPDSFKFVWLAYIYVGIIAVLLFVKNQFLVTIDDELITNLFVTGVILNFLMGVGIKLFPVFLGLNQFNFQIIKKEPFYKSRYFIISILILLNLTLILDLNQNYKFGNVVRSLIILFLLINQFKIYQRPKISFHAIGIWLALLSIPLGIFLRSFDLFLTFGIHIFFICGFSLITLLVAGRVTASHGGHDLAHEKKNKFFILLILSAFFAGILRFIPSVVEKISIISFYNWAFIFWIVFLFSWLLIFIKKLFWPIKEA